MRSKSVKFIFDIKQIKKSLIQETHSTFTSSYSWSIIFQRGKTRSFLPLENNGHHVNINNCFCIVIEKWHNYITSLIIRLNIIMERCISPSCWNSLICVAMLFNLICHRRNVMRDIDATCPCKLIVNILNLISETRVGEISVIIRSRK